MQHGTVIASFLLLQSARWIFLLFFTLQFNHPIFLDVPDLIGSVMEPGSVSRPSRPVKGTWAGQPITLKCFFLHWYYHFCVPVCTFQWKLGTDVLAEDSSTLPRCNPDRWLIPQSPGNKLSGLREGFPRVAQRLNMLAHQSRRLKRRMPDISLYTKLIYT